jgi:tetratricopeptide (TPR) repeat protein
LARKGEYKAAFEAANRLGFDSILVEEDAKSLLLLANTARYAGRAQLAKKAYEALRRRHSGSANARIAAFYLARVAQDATGQPRVAVRWLETYLREAPSGHLAASARARLIDTLLQLGDRAGARRVARDYIRLHPKGPHIELARSLLRSSGRR